MENNFLNLQQTQAQAQAQAQVQVQAAQFQNQNMMVPNSYNQTEILCPEYTQTVNLNELAYPPSVYNYNPSAQVYPNTDNYYVYEQNKSVKSQEYDLDEILRQNEDVWKAYKTGKFDVLTCLEECNKIILKQRSSRNLRDDDYKIKRYKITLNRCKKSNKKNDEILLVSYNQQQQQQQQQQKQEKNLSRSNSKTLTCSSRSSSSSSSSSNSSSSCSRTSLVEKKTYNQVTGPGSELIAQLIEADESDIEYLPQTNTNLSKSRSVANAEQEIVEQEEAEESNLDSFDEEYIQQFAPLADQDKSTASLEQKQTVQKNSRLSKASSCRDSDETQNIEIEVYDSEQASTLRSKRTSSKQSRNSSRQTENYTPKQTPIPQLNVLDEEEASMVYSRASLAQESNYGRESASQRARSNLNETAGSAFSEYNLTGRHSNRGVRN